MAAIRGWVYIITNKAMPGLVKVGFSTKDPVLRASELNHTGAPHPFEVAYDILVEEPRDVEQKVHDALREKREGKEWFRCSVEEAISAIGSVGPGIPNRNGQRYEEDISLDILEIPPTGASPEVWDLYLQDIRKLPEGRQKQDALRRFNGLQKEFEEMQALARKRGFEIT